MFCTYIAPCYVVCIQVRLREVLSTLRCRGTKWEEEEEEQEEELFHFACQVDMHAPLLRSLVTGSKFGLIAETIAARTSRKWIK